MKERSCRACGRPATRRWKSKNACGTCYERARRHPDQFMLTSAKRQVGVRKLAQDIKQARESGMTYAELREKFKISTSTAHRYAKG